MSTQLDDDVHRAVVADGGDVEEAARRHALARAPLLHGAELDLLVRRVVARVQGLGPLEALLADPTVTEVMVNGDRGVWVERDGHLEQVELVLDAATVLHLIERVVAPLGRRVDRSSPIVDARLPSGARVHAVALAPRPSSSAGAANIWDPRSTNSASPSESISTTVTGTVVDDPGGGDDPGGEDVATGEPGRVRETTLRPNRPARRNPPAPSRRDNEGDGLGSGGCSSPLAVRVGQ